MKIKSYNILVLAMLLMLILGCSKEDDFQLFDPEIIFVNSDSTLVLEGDCLDSDKTYALQITLSSNNGDFKAKQIIEYTINGVVYSVTFTELGAKTIPLNFINGINIAQLVKSGNSISIDVEYCNAQIVAKRINFVHVDGSEILAGECLDLNLNYGVKIEAEKVGKGSLEPTKIAYTINDVVFNTTFTEVTSKLLPVTVSAGDNVAQIIGTSIDSTIHFVDQSNFVLVE